MTAALPRIEVHLLAYNEEAILPYTLRHYLTYAARVIVHDAFSTDRTRDVCREYGVEVRDWETDGINDQLARELKDHCWKGTDADWAITADADELLHFPRGAGPTLAEYDRQGVAVAKPHGWELCSDVFPTTAGQIYDEVWYGARDDKWYAKPILFSPRRVASMNFAPGAHSCNAVLRDGTVLGDPKAPSDPPCFLLHCKHLGPVERVAAEYAADRQRLSAINVQRKWGNFDDPLKHAREKRAGILSRIERVV